jgi:hypothetical protein
MEYRPTCGPNSNKLPNKFLAFMEHADHSGRTVLGMNYLRSFKHWDRGFESHSKHGRLYALQSMGVCMHLFCLRVGSALRRTDTRSRSPTECLRIKNLKWNTVFHGCPMHQTGSNRKERESSWDLNPHIVLLMFRQWQKKVLDSIIYWQWELTRHIRDPIDHTGLFFSQGTTYSLDRV